MALEGVAAIIVIADNSESKEVIGYAWFANSISSPEHLQECEIDSPKLDFSSFRRGTQATSTTKFELCENDYLDALVGELTLNIRLLIFLFPIVSHDDIMDETLPNDALKILSNINIIMKECRRLKAAPELFPSSSARRSFLEQIGSLTVAMSALDDVARNYNERVMESDLSQQLPEHPETSEEEMPEETKEIQEDKYMQQNPLLHNHAIKLDGQNPWNYWLDNSAGAREGWIAIQHKIPRMGDKLNRQHVLLYEALEDYFEDNDFVLREKEDATAVIGEPGDAYRHMTWKYFGVVPNNYIGAEHFLKSRYDEDGIITLEYISGALGRGLVRDWTSTYSQAVAFNCPYFRFAVAYQPEDY